MRSAGVGLLVLAAACGGPLGRAPLVLIEVPNNASGQAVIALGAERSGCRVTREDQRMLLACPEGNLAVPTIPGPPTFAVQCIDDRMDVPHCRDLARKILLASEAPEAS